MKKVLRQQAATVTLMAIVFSFFEVGALVGLAIATSFLSVLILALLMATNVAFHWLLKAPTRAGRDLLDKIEGFGMFLRGVDGDRLNRLAPPDKTPALFEKYLPYAVALNAEQAWAQQFSTVLENARQTGYSPAWYTGGDRSLGLSARKLVCYGRRQFRRRRRWRRRWRLVAVLCAG
jgi:Predicted membrane protein (DUF2207)